MASLEQQNRRQGILFVAFATLFLVAVIGGTYHYSDLFLNKAYATPALHADTLFNTTLIFTGIAFFATQILLFIFVWRYRAQYTTRATHIKGSVRLEIVWMVVPLIIFIFLFIQGQSAWTAMTKKVKDNLHIEVVAEQFTWHTRYPGDDGLLGRSNMRFVSIDNPTGIDTTDLSSSDDFVPLQMHVPKGRPVTLVLRSKDVIHSFYVPLFKTKMDAVPGMTTSINLTATHTTDEMRSLLNNPEFEFEVACTELCGRMHFGMKLILVVDTPEQFESWSRQQQQQEKIASDGKL